MGKKELLLSISEHMLCGGLDSVALTDLARVRKQIRDVAAMLLGDSQLEPVEMLAIPLQLVPDLVDPSGIRADLEPAVGLMNWPLTFYLTKMGISRDEFSGHLYVTMNISPDHYTRATLECQFLKNQTVEDYPPLRMFRVSRMGLARARKIYAGLEKMPKSLLEAKYIMEVQVRNLLLLTPFQSFKLRLCGLEAHQNNLQWHDLCHVPSGYRDRDFLSRFRHWGEDDRMKTEGNSEMTPAQADTPLGRLCPWLTEATFKEEWKMLSPLTVELVYTPGATSKTDKVKSLLDTPETARVVRESLQFNFRQHGTGSAEGYLREILELPAVVENEEVGRAVQVLGGLLEGRQAGNADTNQVRWSEMGFDATGERQKRMSYPEAGMAKRQAVMQRALSGLKEDGDNGLWGLPRGGSGPPIRRRRQSSGPEEIPPLHEQVVPDCEKPGLGADTQLGAGARTRLGARLRTQNDSQAAYLEELNSKKQNPATPFHVSRNKNDTFQIIPRKKNRLDWLAQLALPAPSADRQWRKLLQLLPLPSPVTIDGLRSLLLSPEFHDMLADLEAAEQAGLGVNLKELVDILRDEPELGLAMFSEAEVEDQFANSAFTPQQYKIIRDYANVLGLLVSSQLSPTEFAMATASEPRETRAGLASPRISPTQVWRQAKRVSVAGTRELLALGGERVLNEGHRGVLRVWDKPESHSEVQFNLPKLTPPNRSPAGSEDSPDTIPVDVEQQPDQPWQLNARWREFIDELKPEVRYGQELLLPEAGERYKGLIGGPDDGVYLGSGESGVINFPPLHQLVNQEPLWNLVKEIADYLTIFEGRTPDIRSNDIVNSWQILLALPDKPPALAAMVKEVQERVEDLLYNPVSNALDRSETASRYAT